MPNGEKKGITVRIDADLHAEVSQYLRDHSMTMAEFVSLALDDELHPKNQMKEGNTMANTRTIAVQVPEDLFQRIKDYLQRNNMTQRQFLIGLIEDELERDQTERESQNEAVSGPTRTKMIPSKTKTPLLTILKPIPMRTKTSPRMKARDSVWECEVTK